VTGLGEYLSLLDEGKVKYEIFPSRYGVLFYSDYRKSQEKNDA
jgi:hypothetical protein